MRYAVRQATCCAAVILLSVNAGGCSGKRVRYGGLLPGSIKAYDIVVALDTDSWSRAYGNVLPSLEVDLIGINESEKGTWENYPVNDYFSPNDPLRRDADRSTLTFTSEDRQVKTLSMHDSVWGTWIGQTFGGSEPGKGSQWLFVVANIPGVSEDMPGDQDPRRIILPLKGSSWPFRTSRIEVVIKSSMAVCTTPLKTDKN